MVIDTRNVCERRGLKGENIVKAWDVAAGVLIVEEAGGVVTDLQGQPFRLETPHPVAGATAALHEQFRALLVRSAAKEAKML